MLTRNSTELTDPGVVPSLADRWSHHTGGTHLKVVPCHWRATSKKLDRHGFRARRLKAISGSSTSTRTRIASLHANPRYISC